MNPNETPRQFLQSHAQALAMRTAEHLELAGITIFVALALGVSLAILAYRRAALRTPLLILTSVLQTIPGIALLVMAMALFHRIGTAPALFALLLYALLPIVQNTLVGLNSLSPALAEAARGLGLSRWQRLRHVRLPLALPMLLAGLRTSSVQTIGLATLAAFVGAGGLGQFINRGLFLSDTRLILLGAIPAALMAVIVYILLGMLGRAMEPGCPRLRRCTMLSASLIGLIVLVVFTVLYMTPVQQHGSITIGSKNFTEQLIVAEMVAQQIEKKTRLPVTRRFGLGGSTIVHQALTDGTIDAAVEYTGTALAAILHQPTPADKKTVFSIVRDAYAKQFQLTWLTPLGFDNSYQLAVRRNDSTLESIATISDLTTKAPQLRAAFDFEFAERADGYQGLRQTYGLTFAKIVDMHPDLLYDALKSGNSDVISAYATDGRLARPWLRTLTDDKHFFPPYEAAIVIRTSTLEAYPELKPALSALSGKLSTAKMRALNAAVDARQMTVEQAAGQALDNK